VQEMGLLTYAGQALLAAIGSLLVAVVLNVAWQGRIPRSDLQRPYTRSVGVRAVRHEEKGAIVRVANLCPVLLYNA
jgi:hypothetical protein